MKFECFKMEAIIILSFATKKDENKKMEVI